MDSYTEHYLFFGDCTKATKILDLPAIDLLVTSPPYFNAPFDYDELFQNYESFLKMIAEFGELIFKSLKPGGIAAINIDDMLIKGIKYPIISDTMKIFAKIGYIIQGRIIWKKPEGYIRISRRSGVFLQNPDPMYFYPDNLLESILIFQKPTINNLTNSTELFFKDIWEMTNVLPIKGRLETNIAAFPEELPKKCIQAFTDKYAWICDPFLGSGTTMKVARELNRNSIGIEILSELQSIIQKKSGFTSENLTNFLTTDKLYLEKIPNDTHNQEERKNNSVTRSQLHHALKESKLTEDGHEFHLMILDLRNITVDLWKANFSDLIEKLHNGRILIIYYDPLCAKKEELRLSYLTDYILSHGLRFRDKITVQHRPETRWQIDTINSSRVIFDHCFYEILIFQKGKFDYKSKSKQEKLDSIIDKGKFQKEKWFLSLWNFDKLPTEECDPIITERILELFLFNDEVVGSNIPKITCQSRRFILKEFFLSLNT
jgi:site-specific DNA-methyltransferase (adenine-specific)